MKLIEKIAAAKTEIKESKLKKEGRNDFSKYDYFTPSQIEALVNQVCTSQKMLTKFDLIRNDLGVTGKLTIFDCESDESLIYEMATAIPEIKATNISQQLGGCVTYTERYLKTSAFGITDNNLDFDSHKPETKKDAVQEANKYIEWINEVNKITRLVDLQAYANLNAEVLTNNPEIKAIFAKRKIELSNAK